MQNINWKHMAALVMLCAVAVSTTTSAQAPAPAAKASEQPSRPDPAQPVNVRIEVTIAEQTGGADASKKVVTLMTSDRQNGVIRSSGNVRSGERYRAVAINVDARPIMLRDNAMRLELGLEYQPQTSGGATTESGLWTVNERVSVVLESGKPLMISQTFDPTSDRKVTVEVKATVLR